MEDLEDCRALKDSLEDKVLMDLMDLMENLE